MFLIDTSGSMSYKAAEHSHIQRREVIGEAISALVAALEGKDSQAEKEAAAGEDAGGVMTILFSGPEDAVSIDDLSSENVRDKWGAIEWGGGTYIVPGWEVLVETYKDEFGSRPADERPAILAVVITDGEAADYQDFVAEMEKLRGTVYVVMAVIGYGPEHDQTFNAYKKVEAHHPDNFRVVTFGSETDPQVIADSLLSLMGS
jgi:hypothetical protein